MLKLAKILFLLSLIVSLVVSQVSFAQNYETVCGPRQCMSCKGTGTATYKNSYREYENLTYKDTGGWNQSREYYYTNSYIKSEQVTGTCHVCGGHGRYKHCKQVYHPSKKVKRAVGTSSKNQSFYKAKRDFAKIKKDLLNGFLLVQDNSGQKHVIALNKNSASYRYIEKNVNFHNGVLNTAGKYISHKVHSKTKNGEKKASFYDKNFNLKYVIKGNHIALGYKDLYWVESGGFDNYYAYGKTMKFPKVKLYNARTRTYLTKNTYVLGVEPREDELVMIQDGYIPAFAMVRDIDGKWVKRMGVIDLNDRVVVPFVNKEISEYESKLGLVTVLNAFDTIDYYSIEKGLIEPVGDIKYTCPDGSVVRKVKRQVIDEFSSRPRDRVLYSFMDGKTKRSFPYIFTSTSCYEDDKYLTVRTLDGYDYMIVGDDRFYKKANSGFLANHKKEPVSMEGASPFKPIDLRYQGRRTIFNPNNNKVGHKYYQDGATVFDKLTRLAGGIYKAEQNGKEGLLVKHEFEQKMELSFPKVELGDRSSRRLIPFKGDTGKWGLMDTRLDFSEQVILDPNYDEIRIFYQYALAYKNGQEFLFEFDFDWQKPHTIKEIQIGNYKDKRQELLVEYTRKLNNINFTLRNKAYGHLRAILPDDFTVIGQQVVGRVHNYRIKNEGLLVIFPDSEGNAISAKLDDRIKLLSLLEEDSKRGNYLLLAEYHTGMKGLVQISKGNIIPDTMDGKPNGFKVQTYKYTEIVDDTFGFQHYYNTALKPKPSYIFSKADKFYGVSKDKEKDIFIYHFTPFKLR